MAYNANNPTRNGTVMLCDYHSYTTWFQQLIATCEFDEVWSIVNPDSLIERMPMPVEPVLPEIEDYSPIPTVDTPTVRQGLSASGQKAYKEDLDQHKNLFNIYKTRLSRYEREANNLKAVAVWIQTNVSHNLQKTCCKPHLTLKVWIDTLRSTVGVEEELEEERAVRAYLNALKPMRLPTQWETWLIDYEFAATEAEAQGVGETIKKKRMFRDFMDSVVKVAPSWVSSFQATGLKNPTTTRREMVQEFREAMARLYPLKSNKRAAFMVNDNSQHGALAADALCLEEKENSSQTHKETPLVGRNNTSNSNRGRPRGKQQRPASKNTQLKRPSEHEPAYAGGAKCPGCYMRHRLHECYYLNPEIAPEWWRPHETTQELIEYKKSHDATFQGLLRGLGKTRLHTAQLKPSQTPTTSPENEQ
jgi:hypothetical protein